jgi:hypothetical protein
LRSDKYVTLYKNQSDKSKQERTFALSVDLRDIFPAREYIQELEQHQ